MADRHVETPYGPMPGCPDCGTIVLCGTHLCEHGVTPAPMPHASAVLSVMTGADWDLYARLTGTEEPR